MSLAPGVFPNLMNLAKAEGFDGFGGRCGAAAVVIRDLLFPEGKLVAAANRAFWDHGVFLGHVAVECNGAYFDADGMPKEWDEIESWGMLDPEDSDYAERAEDLGFEWTEDAAYDVVRIELTPEQIFQHLPTDAQARIHLRRVLQAALVTTVGEESGPDGP